MSLPIDHPPGRPPTAAFMSTKSRLLPHTEAELPAPAASSPDTTQDAPEPAEGRHVLLIEDNADARETLRDLLELWGHRVTVAATGEAGLKQALAIQPELVLVDIGLPDIDGYEIARRLRAESRAGTRRMCLVALTGYGQPEDRHRALAAGFDAHLVKPLDAEELFRLLDGTMFVDGSGQVATLAPPGAPQPEPWSARQT